MEWQPIKTAPKNISVLVATTDPLGNFGVRVVIARLIKYDRKLSSGKYWGWNHTGSKWTHWMPLPEPPK